MLTSIIGFPRVGTLRELKFATENISEAKFQLANFNKQLKISDKLNGLL